MLIIIHYVNEYNKMEYNRILTIELKNSFNIHKYLMINEEYSDYIVNIDIFENNYFRRRVKIVGPIFVVSIDTSDIELFLLNLYPILTNNNPHIKFNNLEKHKYYNMTPNITKKITTTSTHNTSTHNKINLFYLPSSLVYLDYKNNKISNLPNKITKIPSLFHKHETRMRMPLKLNTQKKEYLQNKKRLREAQLNPTNLIKKT